VNDAFKFLGSTHIAMPHDAYRVWQAAENLGCISEPFSRKAGEGGATRWMKVCFMRSATNTLAPTLSTGTGEGAESARD
jgi:hypothetical protein